MTYRERLRELDQILEHHLDALNQLSRVSEEDLARPVCANNWTIGQVIDHLLRGNESLLVRLNEAADSAPSLEADSDLVYSLKERGILSVLGPKPFIKVPIPPGAIPTVPPTVAPHIERLIANLEGYRALVKRAWDKDLRATNVVSVLDRRLSMSGMGFLDGIIRHLQYHWSQIEAGRQRLGK